MPSCHPWRAKPIWQSTILASLEKKIGVSTYKTLSAKIRREVAEHHQIQIIPPYYGAGLTQAGAGTQAGTNI